MNIERVQKYLLDLEELLRMKDQHLQTMRGMQMEENLLGSDLFGNTFREDRQKLLEQIKESRKEASDAIEVIDTLLAALTDSPREKIIEVKVALNRVAEARALVAEIEQTAEIEPESISQERIELTRDFYNRVLEQTQNLVPASYDPNANLIAVR